MSHMDYYYKREDEQQQMVEDLVRKYYKHRQPSPVLRDLFRRPEEADMLVKSLKRQVSLIKCRSPSLEDCQVNQHRQQIIDESSLLYWTSLIV